MFETLLHPSQLIGKGYTISALTEYLSFAAGNKTAPYFGHTMPLPDMDHSIRLVGKESFEGSIALPRPLTPAELALQLMRLSESPYKESAARYKIKPTCTAIKGWTINRSDEYLDAGHNPIIAAYATWIEP